MSRRACWPVLAACLAAAVLAVAVPTAGQGGGAIAASDKAAAQTLFDEGRTLMEDEQYEAACAKFAESQRLDPAVGTQLNLARCYEKLGRTASAWIHYLEAASRARKAGQSSREELARKLADELQPSLSKLTIEVPNPLPGLEVRRDETLVKEPQWGSAVPVDPGEHRIVATAPGHRPWSQMIQLDPDGAELVVTVGELEPAPDDEPTVPVPTPDTGPDVQPTDGTTQRVLGIVIGSLGLAGIAVGTATGVLAMNKNDESLEHCPVDPNRCTAEGVDLRDEALTMGTVSTVGFAVGGAALVAGVILLLTAPSDGLDEGASEEAIDEDTAVRVRVLPTFEAAPASANAAQSPWHALGIVVHGSF